MRWKSFLIPVANMDADALRAYVSEHREGTFTLLDVRQPGEYEKAHLPGTRLIPLPQLADRMGELDREKPVIVY
ncbi:MAG: rhodanese-like domain-containing protein [Deltaproteobacteria bacterium]|nr:rhodanese-like domain-containing protein [Deltaproteobacteria bacterium]MBW2283583.1 rhodanese-like domain-containing protein [Deltaproteobacteria bacterium]